MVCFNVEKCMTAKSLLLDRYRGIRTRSPARHLPARMIASKIFDTANISHYDNWTLLHFSAHIGIADNCLKLLKEGAHVNKTNARGDTPLHLACLKANYACIKVILKYKPELNIKNYAFNTPLNCFIGSGSQNEDILKQLLNAGANPDIYDADGYSALHVLAEQEDTEKTEIFARLLIKYNANVNLQNNSRETPLHMALKGDGEDLAKILLESGASIDIPDESGKTAMDLALEKKTHYPRIFDLLGKHLIMQNCCGLLLNLRHLEKECNTEGCQYFKKRAEEEIQRLKSNRAGESTVTYYDILVSPARRVARYLCNQTILVSLQEFNMDKYVFGSLLLKKFHEGLKYYHGINLGISAAQKVFPFLPVYCIEELIKYLDINDFSNFDKACTFCTQKLK